MTIQITIESRGHFSLARAGNQHNDGPSAANALSGLLVKLAKSEGIGTPWECRELGMKGVLGLEKRKPRRRKDTDKGAVFDLLGGKMNGPDKPMDFKWNF